MTKGEIKSWFEKNHTLAIFLIGQALAIAAAGGSLIAYYVKMETRVSILETRGAAYTIDLMNTITHRLTVLEQKADRTSQQLERVIDALLKDRDKTGGYRLQGDDSRPVTLPPVSPKGGIQ